MNQPPEVLQLFMQDFWSRTTPHPSLKYFSLYCINGIPVVAFEVITGDGHVWLERINSWQEGHGYGSQALDWFCTLADKHGVEIRGNILPPQGGKLTAEQLAAWYQRRGFNIDGIKICREPQPAAEKAES